MLCHILKSEMSPPCTFYKYVHNAVVIQLLYLMHRVSNWVHPNTFGASPRPQCVFIVPIRKWSFFPVLELTLADLRHPVIISWMAIIKMTVNAESSTAPYYECHETVAVAACTPFHVLCQGQVLGLNAVLSSVTTPCRKCEDGGGAFQTLSWGTLVTF